LARPREFDEIAALEAAMRRFWARGYEATSIRDLADDMGISGASLYNAFGDKRALYQRALEHYLEQSVRDRVTRLEPHRSPVDAIRMFFDEVIRRSVTDRERRGCMLFNAALEMSPHDPGIRDLVSAELRFIEAFFCRTIAAGQQDGTVTRAQPAAELARMLLGILAGLRVLARTRPEPALLNGAASTALALLTAASAPPGRMS
jgi:TetR/AcrR family transcriptional regulator, transcriptional repressor for nem operon